MAFGLTKDGFKRKRFHDIRNDIASRWKQLFGEDSNTETGINAKIIDLLSFALSGVWQLAERVYNSAYVHKAEGKALDNIVNNRLMQRRPAEKSRGEIEITGQAGTVVEAGFLVGNGKHLYITTETVMIGEDGKAVAPVEAQQAGAQSNTAANTVTEIMTPIIGVQSVTNPAPISGGRNEETDDELRRRYALTRVSVGSPTTNGIRAEVLGVPGVLTCTVIENRTMQTDADGRPPKSFEVFVLGGEDRAIAEAIFRRRAAGIQAYGQTVIEVVDDAGEVVPIGFTRAQEVPVYIQVGVVTTDEFPRDGTKLIRRALIEHIGGMDEDGNVYAGLQTGQNVYFTKLVGIISNVQGVERVTILNIGTSPDDMGPMRDVEIGRTQVAMTGYDKIEVLTG